MNISSRTPEGLPGRCPICGKDVVVDPSIPPGDATCPHCGSLLWISADPHNVDPAVFISRDVYELVRALDLLPGQALVLSLGTKHKAEAIPALVKRLIAAGEITRNDEDDVVAAILRREELGSTGLGRGVAIPHAKHAAVNRVVAAIGRCPNGVDFESLDGEPVHLIVLLVSPPDKPGDHLRALERISSALRSLAP
jgi:mannitol/fructose-specific phosphotransferase system IIA component (Ntr-type)